MEERSTIMLVLNFLIAITVIPLGNELFVTVGQNWLGVAAFTLHPWLAYLFAYLPILMLLWIYLKATLEPLSKWGFVWSNKMLGIAAGVGVVAGIVQYLMSGPHVLENKFLIAADPTLTAAVGWLLMFSVLVPVVEETLFRGVIQTVFTERIKSAWIVHPAILIATGFELLFHISEPIYSEPSGHVLSAIIATLPQLGYVALFGAIGGYIFYRTKSLAGPLLIHAMGNALELLLFWLLV